MEINKEILEKVERIRKEKKYIKKCIKENICPSCGNENLQLTSGIDEDGHMIAYECLKCNFNYVKQLTY